MKKLILTAILSLSGFAVAEPTAYVVYDYTTNKVLDQKNLKQVRPIASITKLMTAHTFLKLSYIAGENGICNGIIPSNEPGIPTKTRLPRNVPIPCHQLFHAMLISSDNYAATALSRAVSGFSQSDFIYEMNRQAKLWGMKDTHFNDVTGLSNGNVSTVADLALMSSRIMNDPFSKNIVVHVTSKAGVTLNVNNMQKVSYNNTNKLIREGTKVLLSKTGTTTAAGHSLLHVQPCRNTGHVLGIISLNNPSSDARVEFTKNKLFQHLCF